MPEYKSTAQTVKYTLKTTLNSMVYSNLGLRRVHLHKSLFNQFQLLGIK